MRNLQKEKLASYVSDLDLQWHDRIQDVSPLTDDDTFTIVVAHEFFDALPIHLFEKRPGGFREVFVDLDTSISAQLEKETNPRLRYVVSPAATLASNLLMPNDDPYLKGLSDGARVEVCPEAYEIAACSAQILGGKGAGLIIDYGGERHFGSSFRVSCAAKLQLNWAS